MQPIRRLDKITGLDVRVRLDCLSTLISEVGERRGRVRERDEEVEEKGMRRRKRRG